MSGYVRPGEQRRSDGRPHQRLARVLILSLCVAATLLFLFSGVALTIAAENSAPIVGTPAYTLVAPDHASGAVQGQVHVTDPDLDVLTYSVTGDPFSGAVSVNSADGTFTYTPTPAARHQAAYENAAPDQLADNFTISVDDGNGHAVTVPVAVAIDPTNTPPAMTLVVGDPDAATGRVTVLITVTDPDLDPMVYIITHDPAYGTVAPTPGGYVYTPTPAAREAAASTPGVDTDTFAILASDQHGGIDTEIATVIISPNTPPVAGITPLSAPNPATGAVTTTLTASDPEGSPVIVINTAPSHGTVDVIDNLDGTWTYTYRPNNAARLNAALAPGATDSFVITVSDAQGGATTVPVDAIPVAPGYYSVTDTIPLPVGAGTVAISGNTAYLGNFGDGTVTVMDLTTYAAIGAPIAVGGNPSALVLRGDHLYVSQLGDDSVAVINTTTNTVITAIPVVNGPYGMAVSGERLYVANSGWDTIPDVSAVGFVSVIDTTSDTVVTSIPVGAGAVGVAVNSDGSHVYVSNFNDGTVSVIDTTTNTVVATIGVGANPSALQVSGNRLYVANYGDGTVTVIDTTDNSVLNTITVGTGPVAMVVSSDGSLVYVTNSGEGTVTVIGTATGTVVDTNPALGGVQPLTVGGEPAAIAVDGGRLAVLDTGGSQLTLVEITANGSPAVGNPAYTLTAADPVDGSLDGHLYIADPDGDPIFVVEIIQGTRNGTLTGDPLGAGGFSYTPELAARIRAGTGGEDAEHLAFKVTDGVNPPVTVTIDIPISPTDMTVTDTIASGPATAMVVSPDGARAYLAADNGNVSVIDTATNTVIATIGVGANPSAVALSGNRLYVTNAGSDNVSVIDTTTNSVIQTIAVGDDPRGVAVSENSGLVYVGNYGSNSVTAIDPTTSTVVDTIGVGSNPWAAAASADGGRYIYVANTGGNSVSVIDTTDNVVITTFTGLNAPIGLGTGAHDGRNWLYVTNPSNGTVTVFDTDTNTLVNTVNVGPRPYNVVLSADGSIAYVSLSGEVGNPDNRVVPIDTRYFNVLDSDFDIPGVQPLTVGTAPQGMAFNPATNQLYVLNKADSTISVVEMTAAFTNSAPTAPVVDVTPNRPVTTDDLLCSITTESTDADGDTVGYSYAWYKDDVLQAALTTNTVAAANTAKGQVWKCVVTPNDGTVDGPTAQDQVTISDTAPPIITPPTDKTAEATSSAGAWVAWERATATDDVDGNLPAGAVLYYLAYGTPGQHAITSPYLFPLGETTVTCAATDASGNIGVVTFKVTVSDTTPPEVSRLSVSTAAAALGETVSAWATVSDLASLIAGAEYRLGSGPWTSMSPSDGRFDSQREEVWATLSGLAEGLYTVHVRATDSASPANTSSGGASVSFRVGGVPAGAAPLPTPTFTLLYLAGEGGAISGQSRQEVEYSQSGAEVTAVPDERYEFVRWSDGLTTRSRTDRFVAGNLTVTAEFRLIPPPLVTDHWTDITDAQWLSGYGLEVKDVARVADGFPDGTLRPFIAITRAQFTKMALAGLGLSTQLPATSAFRDVPASHEYFGWAEGARKEGLIGGYADGTFRPGALITREQANSILGRYLVQKELAAHGHIQGSLGTYASLEAWFAAEGGSVLARFADAFRLASVHAPYTAYLVYRGVVLGSESEGRLYLRPLANLVRAEAIALILRVDALD